MYIGPGAEQLVNVDSKTHRVTEENMRRPDRWTFDDAAAHLYYLMTSDSYSRYAAQQFLSRQRSHLASLCLLQVPPVFPLQGLLGRCEEAGEGRLRARFRAHGQTGRGQAQHCRQQHVNGDAIPIAKA